MQTTILSVIPLALLLFSFGVAVEPTYPDRELPLLKGDPYGSNKVNDVVQAGQCKMGRDANQCILKRRDANKNGWEVCDRDKPCTKDGNPCSVRYRLGLDGKARVINVNCHLY
ncbi:hypothetical protein BDV27DRAFT_14530 [Aspergillus caelatus]|uniref:Uncharacterized protein n=1 Tax=Aspergillus caelatus TaxID=61420 RepID=A0A5N7AHJ6_9EURO|nr:uncharacterized protein BDV27DRAFT_14530 [Aspergillus caelatus]KAE8369361.1 hypothetical protein BDV27DRAFT_14530 [Aspergillus caelatus]